MGNGGWGIGEGEWGMGEGGGRCISHIDMNQLILSIMGLKDGMVERLQLLG